MAEAGLHGSMAGDIPSLPEQANPHFMRALGALSQHREVELSDDLYAHNGSKLLARGTRITPDIYDRIIQHRLRSPLESKLVSGEHFDPRNLRQEAEALLARSPLLQSFCHWQQGRVTPLGMLERLHLSPQAHTLLAVAEHRNPGMRQHQLKVALIAMGLAHAWRYNDPQLLAGMLEASLFHDIGELYIAPFSVGAGQALPAREWIHYAAHPIIGAALAREVAGLSKLSQTAILEHHERQDGFGYPRGRHPHALSPGGLILGLADTIAALLRRDRSRLRLEIALKILPGELSHDLLGLVGALLEDCPPDTAGESPADDMQDEIHLVFNRIHAAQEIHSHWQGQRFSAATRAVIDDIFERFIRVQRAFASTGMDGFEMLAPRLSDAERAEARLEARCVLDEIFWRLTRLARELVLRCAKLPPDEAAELMQMADALAGHATLATAA